MNASRLIAARAPVDLPVTPGAFHAFDILGGDTGIGQRFTAAKLDALRRAKPEGPSGDMMARTDRADVAPVLQRHSSGMRVRLAKQRAFANTATSAGQWGCHAD